MNKVLYFVAGASIGALAAWKITSMKYESIIQEEIDSVKEAFANKKVSDETIKDPDKENDILAEKAVHKPDIMEYAAKLSDEKYTNYSSVVDIKTDSSNVEDDVEEPYVISPEEFGEMYDYEKISLTYFADGTLADDADEVIEDVDEIVGSDALDHFGEYEDDSVYVRDDRKMVDYEILMDTRNYKDYIAKEKPYLHVDTEE